VPDRNLLLLAGAASASAGLVHAAAAGGHAGVEGLALIFSATAAAQLAAGALAALRPTRWAAAAVIGLNVAALAAWLLSRTVGLPLLPGETGVQPVGLQDLAGALLALVAAGLAAGALVPARSRRRRPLAGPVVAAACVALLVAALPAMAAEHDHGDATGHDHGDATDHDHGDDHGDEPAAAATEHDADHQADRGSTVGTSNAAAAGGHHHGAVPARLDHAPTPEQLVAAHELVDRTTADISRYAETAAATAAGYRTSGDQRSGFEHFVSTAYLRDAAILDPERPESLVYRVEPDGGRTLVSAMYVMPRGSTMDDVPDIAGNLTVWHSHDNLCFDVGNGRLSPPARGGGCSPGTQPGNNAPMLHVWVKPNPCGPFAGTDSNQMNGSCIDPATVGF
jgi:hypothetical protein